MRWCHRVISASIVTKPRDHGRIISLPVASLQRLNCTPLEYLRAALHNARLQAQLSPQEAPVPD